MKEIEKKIEKLNEEIRKTEAFLAECPDDELAQLRLEWNIKDRDGTEEHLKSMNGTKAVERSRVALSRAALKAEMIDRHGYVEGTKKANLQGTPELINAKSEPINHSNHLTQTGDRIYFLKH